MKHLFSTVVVTLTLVFVGYLGFGLYNMITNVGNMVAKTANAAQVN